MWMKADGTYWDVMAVCQECGGQNYQTVQVNLDTGESDPFGTVGEGQYLACPTCGKVTHHVSGMVQVPTPDPALGYKPDSERSEGSGLCLIITMICLTLATASAVGGWQFVT